MDSWFNEDGSAKTPDQLTKQQLQLLTLMQQQELARITKWGAGSGQPFADEREEVTELGEANVFSSKFAGYNAHRPVLDIDIPAYLTPSSSPGHSHLVIDTLLPWEQYEKLLQVLAEAGIIQKGYLDAALRRQATFLRLPWVKKSAGAVGVL